MPSTDVVIDDVAGTIAYSQWIKRGIWLVNRDCLDYDDADQTWNYLSARGIDPDKYGIINPMAHEFSEKTRSQLIQEILDLRREITGMMQAGF